MTSTAAMTATPCRGVSGSVVAIKLLEPPSSTTLILIVQVHRATEHAVNRRRSLFFKSGVAGDASAASHKRPVKELQIFEACRDSGVRGEVPRGSVGGEKLPQSVFVVVVAGKEVLGCGTALVGGKRPPGHGAMRGWETRWRTLEGAG